GGIVLDMRPGAVLGAGGCVAGPVGVAAVARRVPIVLAEADSHLGLTNRLLARWARRVCLAFPIPGRDGERYLVTGRPVPPPATDLARARARFGLAPEDTCVLVFGGSLGARTINEAAVTALAGADVGARGGRTEHERQDDDQDRGEGAPAVGRDGLHQRAVTRGPGEGCAVNDIAGRAASVRARWRTSDPGPGGGCT